MKNIIAIILILTIGIVSSLYAEVSAENKKKAQALTKEAIEHINNQKTKKAVDLLKEAQSLDDESITYPYEIAVAYYDAERYIDAVRVLDSLLRHPQCNDRIYQLLGNSLDFLGNKEKANVIYFTGLKKFPNSGRLYMELGSMEVQQENYEEALKFWSKGTQVDPNFPNLYYYISQAYNALDRNVLALLTAEIYLNLTNNQQKYAEVSKFIFDIYKENICKEDSCSNRFTLLPPKAPNLLIFEIEYEEFTNISANEIDITYKNISIAKLTELRTLVLQKWIANNNHITYPNTITDYQKEALDEGVFDIYSYWILAYANEEEVKKLMQHKAAKAEKMVNWQSKNRFKFEENTIEK